MWNFDCGSFDNFQSYQSRQINPDQFIFVLTAIPTRTSFNRINPNSSIPTTETGYCVVKLFDEFQSYQSKQINPDFKTSISTLSTLPCFNRINSDRSIPTLPDLQNNATYGKVSIVSIKTVQSRLRKLVETYGGWLTFQSYQSRQINPDASS